ncbi:MAG: adenylosuccinate lyase [Candidatus Ancaeobacter aquaticus]|nr:adenylosuccinate lyase [Candidatus Ancaeobacter aquaticus]
MIKRYSLPKMDKIWSDENRFDIWLKIEVLACEAQSKLGLIPKKALSEIQKKARFNIKRIDKIEKETRHDVIAFLTSVSEYVGPSSRYIHYGLTSSDVVDTALSVMMAEAARLILTDIEGLLKVVKVQAKKHKYTVMVGRTHGVHAEPTTFGLKMALMYSELVRARDRMKRALDIISVGKISGAVGTHANVDPFVEEYVCKKLGLKPAPISTQIVQRDRHAEYLSHCALVAATLEKYALEIRGLQKTEIREVEEGFAKGQKGSSAMPHKRNPVACERVCGLARVIRSNAMSGFENIALWHERDISHSSAERIIIPDSTLALNYILHLMTEIMTNLVVYPENMKENMDKSKGLIFSQKVLLDLTRKGLSREIAYKIVQRNAMNVWNKGLTFQEALLEDKELCAKLSKKDISELFDLACHLKDISRVFRVVGIK